MSFQIESPHAVRKLPGGEAAGFPINLHLPDLEGMVLVIDRVFDFYPLAGGLPVVIKDVHTEQFALAVWAEGFIFPGHVYPSQFRALPAVQPLLYPVNLPALAHTLHEEAAVKTRVFLPGVDVELVLGDLLRVKEFFPVVGALGTV